MFAVLYRWKLRAGTDESFRAAWRAMTESIAARSGTGGSRLHQTSDGEYVAYAVWPDRETWQAARELPSANPEAGAAMRACIERAIETVSLEVVDDLLRSLPAA